MQIEPIYIYFFLILRRLLVYTWSFHAARNQSFLEEIYSVFKLQGNQVFNVIDDSILFFGQIDIGRIFLLE